METQAKRGVLPLVLGGLAIVAGLLAGLLGHGDCGSAFSPAPQESFGLGGFLQQANCDSELAGWRWFAIIVLALGVLGVIVGAVQLAKVQQPPTADSAT